MSVQWNHLNEALFPAGTLINIPFNSSTSSVHCMVIILIVVDM